MRPRWNEAAGTCRPSVIIATECGDLFAVGHLKLHHAEDVGAVLGAIPDHRDLIARLEHFLGPPAPVQSAGISEFAVPFHERAALVGHVDKQLAVWIDK